VGPADPGAVLHPEVHLELISSQHRPKPARVLTGQRGHPALQLVQAGRAREARRDGVGAGQRQQWLRQLSGVVPEPPDSGVGPVRAVLDRTHVQLHQAGNLGGLGV
jgi:hypothetical protein